jgi:hypothetical protein
MARKPRVPHVVASAPTPVPAEPLQPLASAPESSQPPADAPAGPDAPFELEGHDRAEIVRLNRETTALAAQIGDLDTMLRIEQRKLDQARKRKEEMNDALEAMGKARYAAIEGALKRRGVADLTEWHFDLATLQAIPKRLLPPG